MLLPPRPVWYGPLYHTTARAGNDREEGVAAGQVTRYVTRSGARIYCIPVRVFATLTANVYLIVAGDVVAFIDTGSGLDDSTADLQAGMAQLRDLWSEPVTWADLTRIIITHAHIDHYGGLGFVRTQTAAPVAVHSLDRRVLVNHRERLVLASRALAAYLWRAGVAPEQHAMLMDMYGWSKELFRSIEVATVLHDGDLLDDVLRVYHVPGHCPGQICLQIDDVLLSADHVLLHTSPHMAPESLTSSTGLDHYLQSLRRIAAVPNVGLALGGHEGPIDNIYERIRQIEASHQRKLDRVLHYCAAPRTIAEISQLCYPAVTGYDVLLALEEIGAHVEYLDQRGELAIANLDAVSTDMHVAPRYRRS